MKTILFIAITITQFSGLGQTKVCLVSFDKLLFQIPNYFKASETQHNLATVEFENYIDLLFQDLYSFTNQPCFINKTEQELQMETAIMDSLFNRSDSLYRLASIKYANRIVEINRNFNLILSADLAIFSLQNSYLNTICISEEKITLHEKCEDVTPAFISFFKTRYSNVLN